MKFYDFNQNNSGGSFVVNDKVCHRVIIEAKNAQEANDRAEELGCYWDGVSQDIDCSCCGDRWHSIWDNNDYIKLEKWKTEGYKVSVYDGIYPDTIKEWERKYGQHKIIDKPYWDKSWSTKSYVGKIYFDTIEEYAQFLADEYGWTKPDCRIFYKDGTVKEIFSNKGL